MKKKTGSVSRNKGNLRRNFRTFFIGFPPADIELG
jgi:hypothetical protein